VLDFLRRVKEFLNDFSEMRVLGVPMDWFFHFVGAGIVFLVAARLLSLRRALLLTCGLLLGKELFDVFAKTRLEYIRSPTADLAVDLSAGAAGIAAGYFLARRIRSKRS